MNNLKVNSNECRPIEYKESYFDSNDKNPAYSKPYSRIRQLGQHQHRTARHSTDESSKTKCCNLTKLSTGDIVHNWDRLSSIKTNCQLHLRQIRDARGFDGDLSRLLHTLFSPPAEQFGVISLLIVGDGARKSGLAHVRVFDDVPVPDLESKGTFCAINDKSHLHIVVKKKKPCGSYQGKNY